MSTVALALSTVLTLLAAALRFGGASLVQTPRAEALHDAADGDRRALRVAGLLEERASILPALGMIHSGLLVAAAIPAAWALSAKASGLALTGAYVALGVALVLVGDTIPRSLGRLRPRLPAYRFGFILAPAIRIGRRAADMIQEDEENGISDHDVQDSEEIDLISSILEFTDAIVREVMVPRTDMVTVSAADDSDRALDVVIEAGRSRIPVVGENLDDIVGVLYARELLGLMDSGRGPVSVTRLMRPVSFVPETKRVSSLLRELQAEKVHLAIVVDEFGGTAGLVTIEDLLEEIVGEIVDEYDVEEVMVQPLDGGGYLVDGRFAVDDLAELLEQSLPEGDWDTVGGLVLGLAGRVPVQGESFELDDLVIVADRVQGRRISRVRIARPA